MLDKVTAAVSETIGQLPLVGKLSTQKPVVFDTEKVNNALVESRTFMQGLLSGDFQAAIDYANLPVEETAAAA